MGKNKTFCICAALLCIAVLTISCICGCGGLDNHSTVSQSDVSDTDVTPTDAIFVPEVHIEGIELPEEFGSGLYNAQAAFWLINEVRDREGLPPFETGDEALEKAASTRLYEIAEDFSHTRPDGRDNKTALEENDVKYLSCGENLAEGQYTAEQVVYDWLNSPTHREIILDSKFTHASIICGSDQDGKGYWVLLAYEAEIEE
ncbi:MAG: CAP domain-containing protein [Clostridia bacterium]|nr:CAP domain-containing protein [Clostridia bacterium]